MKTLKLSFLVILIMIIGACSNTKDKSEQASSEPFNLEQLVKVAEALTPNIKSMDQVFEMLDLVEAEYFPVLTHDPYKAPEYKVSYPAAAVNLGIYTTDIIYHAYGEDDSKMYLSFAAAQELARYLGIDSDFGRMAIETFEFEEINRDSLSHIMNGLLRDSEKFQSEEELLFVHTAMLAGSFIQKTYISGSLISQSLKKEELSNEDEANLKELIIIYSNQLIQGGLLLNSIEVQQENIKNVIVKDEFQNLMKIAKEIEAAKPEILKKSPAELMEVVELKQAFESIVRIRNQMIGAS